MKSNLEDLNYLEITDDKIILNREEKKVKLPKIDDNINQLLFNHCSKFKKIPYKTEDLAKIEDLSLWHCNIIDIEELPENLIELDLSGCSKLKSLPKFPKTLKTLNLTQCNSLGLNEELAAELKEALERGVKITYPNHFDKDDIINYNPDRPENHPSSPQNKNLRESSSRTNISCAIS